MRIKYIISIAILVALYTAQPAFAGPEELSDRQMTDLMVDDTISDGKNVDDNKKGATGTDYSSTEKIKIIKNPVDDPAELNKAEIHRLENREAEQRVNEQLRNTLMGIPNEPGF